MFDVCCIFLNALGHYPEIINIVTPFVVEIKNYFSTTGDVCLYIILRIKNYITEVIEICLICRLYLSAPPLLLVQWRFLQWFKWCELATIFFDSTLYFNLIEIVGKYSAELSSQYFYTNLISTRDSCTLRQKNAIFLGMLRVLYTL